jgi:hypothetical protein
MLLELHRLVGYFLVFLLRTLSCGDTVCGQTLDKCWVLSAYKNAAD